MRPIIPKKKTEKEKSVSNATQNNNNNNNNKKPKRKSKKVQEIEKRKNNWLDHQKQIQKNSKKLKISTLTNRKESNFKSTESEMEAILNPQKRMTQNETKVRKQWSELRAPNKNPLEKTKFMEAVFSTSKDEKKN